MLFKIIKAYWQCRNTYDVIVINRHWGDIFIFNTEKTHVSINLINTENSKSIAKYGYIGTARVHEGEEII